MSCQQLLLQVAGIYVLLEIWGLMGGAPACLPCWLELIGQNYAVPCLRPFANINSLNYNNSFAEQPLDTTAFHVPWLFFFLMLWPIARHVLNPSISTELRLFYAFYSHVVPHFLLRVDTITWFYKSLGCTTRDYYVFTDPSRNSARLALFTWAWDRIKHQRYFYCTYSTVIWYLWRLWLYFHRV